MLSLIAPLIYILWFQHLPWSPIVMELMTVNKHILMEQWQGYDYRQLSIIAAQLFDPFSYKKSLKPALILNMKRISNGCMWNIFEPTFNWLWRQHLVQLVNYNKIAIEVCVTQWQQNMWCIFLPHKQHIFYWEFK